MVATFPATRPEQHVVITEHESLKSLADSVGSRYLKLLVLFIISEDPGEVQKLTLVVCHKVPKQIFRKLQTVNERLERGIEVI